MPSCKKTDIVVVDINGLKINRSKQFYNQLPKTSIDIIKQYDTQNVLNQCSKSTRNNYIRLLLQLTRETGKSLSDMSKRDIDEFLVRRTGSTMEQYKCCLKLFFKWYGKPELTQHLKHNKVPEKLTPEMMWTEDEILKLTQVVDTDPAIATRDKAIIMTMWDLAVERSVIMNARIGDVYDSGTTMRIKTTGKRRGNIKEFVLECIYSARYIREWLNYHPYSKDKTKPLFCQLDERVLGKPLHSAFVWRLCKKLAKRSGIDKELHPHLIRHSRATDYAIKGISGDTLAYRLRHSNLQTQQRYKHIFPKVHEDRIYEADTGISRTPIKQTKRALIAVPCPKCGEMNDPTALYCKSCTFILNQDMAHLEVEIIDMLRSRFYPGIQRDIKKLEEKGVKIPYGTVEVSALASTYKKLKEDAKLTPEERKKRWAEL